MTEVEKYIDPETGLIQAADHGRDNLALCTATWVGLLSDSEALIWKESVQTFFTLSEVRPGLFRRFPSHLGSNSVDNLVAACVLGRARQVYHWGTVHHYCYNVEEPTKFSFRHWYGRFPGIPPFIKMAAYQPIGLFSQIIFAFACIFSSFSAYGNTSDKCLQHLINQRVGHLYPIVDWGIKVWRGRMMKKYPSGLKELYGIYFGAEHPFTLRARRDFF